VKIVLVPLHGVDSVWPVVAPWVQDAILKARSNRTMLQTYAQVRNGSLWMAVATTGDELADIVGVAILELTGGAEPVCQHVVVAGKGNTDEWFELLIRWPWLKEMGIKKVVSEGRKGWIERLKPMIPSIRVVRVVFTWRMDDL
jgi:hypothetical protein